MLFQFYSSVRSFEYFQQFNDHQIQLNLQEIEENCATKHVRQNWNWSRHAGRV